jgi:solute carrier family 30 (zinc transporter), member 2
MDSQKLFPSQDLDCPGMLPKKLSHHHDHSSSNLKKLYLSVLICFIFMCCEIVGGLLSNSLAILTDAAHILSDILGFCISIISLHITKIPASQRMSYGFHRAEVLGALLSIVLIWGLTVWLLSEGIDRLVHDSPVDGEIMLLTAAAGLLGNIVMGVVLGHTHHHARHRHSDEHEHSSSLNMRAAFLHVVGDAIQSIGVIIAGAIIYFNPSYHRADPICTLIFSVIVLCTTLPIVRDCIRVLMEGTPSEVDTKEIKREIKNIQGVTAMHDLHVWSLSSGKISLSCHIVSNNPEWTLVKATKMIKERFGIYHATLQVETEDEDFDCRKVKHE